ncbi:MAG: methylase domain protein, partial [Hymenobacter sp.]|nr:methylase domain protein [Hymenobacter sp.]
MLRPVLPVNVVTREDLGFRSAKTDYHTHSLHPYPAKFIPQIAHELVTKFSQPDSMVADIFAGSGTTNLEAMRMGRHSYALDVNPVASLITTAKTAIVQPELLARTILEIFTAVTTTAPTHNLQSELIQQLLTGKDQEALLHWFPENNIVELALILDLINQIEEHDLKALLLLIFSSSLKLASNWLDWSVKPQRDRRPQAPENPEE